MTWFFADRRSEFAESFPDICVREVPVGVEEGEVIFLTTTPQSCVKTEDTKWFDDRVKKSLLGAKAP